MNDVLGDGVLVYDASNGIKALGTIDCNLPCKGNGGREIPVTITGLQGSISPERAEAFIKKVSVMRDIPVLQSFLKEHPIVFRDMCVMDASRIKIQIRE